MQTNNEKNNWPYISNSRKLKIQTKRQGAYSKENYPEIKLGGLWLERMGYHPGGVVKVTSIENELIITLIDPGPWPAFSQ